MSKIVGIYGLRNKATNKWYVGQSLNVYERWNDYKRLKCSKQPKIYFALKKYGYGNFDKVVLEECVANPTLLLEREIFWVNEKDSIDNGYNIRNPDLRAEFSEETRKKISKAKLGKTRKPCTDIARENMSKSHRGENHHFYGKKLSKEHRDKLKKAKQNITPETRYKMSVAAKNRPPPSPESRQKMSVASKRYWARLKLTTTI